MALVLDCDAEWPTREFPNLVAAIGLQRISEGSRWEFESSLHDFGPAPPG